MRNTITDQARHYQQVACAIAYLRQHVRSQPSLSELAHHLGMSEFHLQRLFSEWAGVSPKRFLQYLTKQYAKQALRSSADILSVALESGLSGSGRLHDLMVTCEAMSPGEIKRGGAGLTIQHGTAPTPFGDALMAWTPRGICHIGFVQAADPTDALAALKQDWPAAVFVQDQAHARQLAGTLFNTATPTQPLHLMLRGSNFQIKVWEALLDVAAGSTVSYSQLAKQLDMPGAQRAVGSAIAKNRIALLIPCHRVIRESGDSGHYHWGDDRKAALLAWEAARTATG